MKQLLLALTLITFSTKLFSQTTIDESELCDNLKAYQNKTVTLLEWYSSSDQSDKWSLRSQNKNYEETNSMINFDQTEQNDIFYSRKIGLKGCKYILRIPYSLIVPNVSNDPILITGKITEVNSRGDKAILEVTNISRP
jgi:hypothetical protein